jgi:hypothetical protein
VAGSSWGKVTWVPGLDALVRGNGGGAQVSSVSCSSAGNCAAGGHYWDRGEQAFVAVERNGRWGKATGVPGLAALNQGRYASVYALSCGPAGGCAAGGEYTPEAYGQDFDGFLAAEENGRWGKAVSHRGQLGVVRPVGQLRRRRRLHRPCPAPRPGIRHPGQVAPRRAHPARRRSCTGQSEIQQFDLQAGTTATLSPSSPIGDRLRRQEELRRTARERLRRSASRAARLSAGESGAAGVNPVTACISA